MSANEQTSSQSTEYRQLYERREALRRAYDEATAAGAKSASIASAGNSQSYTRYSLAEIAAEIDRVERKMLAILRGPSPYCGTVVTDFSRTAP